MLLLLRFALRFPLPLSGLCLLLTTLVAVPPVHAYEFANAYYPINLEQVVHKRQLYHAPVGKLNLNEADLNQLLLLPEMTPNIALKLMRLRPLSTYHALQQLEGQVPKGQLARLIATLEKRTVLKAPSVDIPVASSGLRQ
jgi:hypothetical protein